MDLDPAVRDRIIAYLTSENLHLAKANVRPWGSYDLAASWDGQAFMILYRTFGWGISPMEAMCITVAEHLQTNNFVQLEGWLGETRLAALRAIVQPLEATTQASSSLESQIV